MQLAMPHEGLVPFFLDRAAVVRGIVLNESDRQPVAGARVTLAHVALTTASREAASGPDGRFEFVSLPPGEARLAARKGELRSDAAGPLPVALTGGQDQESIELLLSPGRVIVGQVIDVESGAPIAGAAVTLDDATQAQTDVAGNYRLEGVRDGQFRLMATHPQFADALGIVTIEGPLEYRCNFTMDPAVTVTVKVIDTDGGPVEAAMVRGSEIQSRYGFIINLKATDATGIAVIERMSRPRFPNLSAEKKGYATEKKDEPVIDTRASSATQVITLRKVTTSKAVAGIVTDPEGSPLAGIHVAWGPTLGTQRPQTGTLTGDSGRYRLDFDYEQSRIKLAAYGEGWAPRILSDTTAGTADEPAIVDFSLEPAHWIEGTVVDEDGRLQAQARVIPYPADRMERSLPAVFPEAFPQTRTGPDGEFRLDNLVGPMIKLLCIAPSSASTMAGQRAPRAEETFDVDQTVRVVLKERGFIHGRVLDRESGRPVPTFTIKMISSGHEVSRYEPGQTFNDPDGRFELVDLVRDDAGIDFNVVAEGYLLKRVERVPSSRADRAPSQEIVISKGLPLQGIVIDPATGQPIAGAEVAAGPPDHAIVWRILTEGIPPGDVREREKPLWQYVKTGADGAFQLREGDPLALYVRAEGREELRIAPDARAPYAVAARQLRIPLSSGLSLSGTVTFLGQPVNGDSMILYRMTGPPPDGARLEAVQFTGTDAAGRYRFEHVAPGHYTLRWTARMIADAIRFEQAIERRCEVREGGENAVNMGEGLGALVFTGRALDPLGKPLRSCTIELHPLFDWEYRGFQTVRIGDQDHPGQFAFRGLRPGVYEVVGYISEFRPRISLGTIDLTGDLQKDLTVDFQ
jgi:protocatechuate 3,4-dioxygenase beta subunit